MDLNPISSRPQDRPNFPDILVETNTETIVINHEIDILVFTFTATYVQMSWWNNYETWTATQHN